MFLIYCNREEESILIDENEMLARILTGSYLQIRAHESSEHLTQPDGSVTLILGSISSMSRSVIDPHYVTMI